MRCLQEDDIEKKSHKDLLRRLGPVDTSSVPYYSLYLIRQRESISSLVCYFIQVSSSKKDRGKTPILPRSTGSAGAYLRSVVKLNSPTAGPTI